MRGVHASHERERTGEGGGKRGPGQALSPAKSDTYQAQRGGGGKLCPGGRCLGRVAIIQPCRWSRCRSDMQLVQLAPGFRPSADDRRGALNDRSLVMRAINTALTGLRGRTRCAQGAHGAGATHKIFVKVAASPSGGTCSQSWVFSSNASLPPM